MTLFDRLRTEPVYNTRAVVQRTGVPADTFRAWERRYGLPVPSRTAGNQRLYSERDIAIIAWLRDQTRAGLTISQAVALFRSDFSNRRAEPFPRAVSVGDQLSNGSPRNPPRAGLGEFRDRIIEALIAFSGGDADRIVEEAIALVSVEDVCLYVLQSALIEIGERWERGDVGAAAEHFASSFVMRKFAALFNLSQPQEGRGPILAACVEGELHEIGLLLMSLFLSRHGSQVIYLGANLPATDLIGAVDSLRPAIVLLSATTDAAVDVLAETVAALRMWESSRSLTSLPVVIGYGGRVFVDRAEWQARIDAVFFGSDAREAVDRVERILAGTGVDITL